MLKKKEVQVKNTINVEFAKKVGQSVVIRVIKQEDIRWLIKKKRAKTVLNQVTLICEKLMHIGNSEQVHHL